MLKKLNFVRLCIILSLFSISLLSADSMEQKIDDLLQKMTLKEKIGQLNQYTGSAKFTGPVQTENRKKLSKAIKNGHVGSLLNVTSAKETRAAQKLAVENSRLGIPLIFGYDVIHGYKTIFPVPLAQASSWDLAQVEKANKVAAEEASAAGVHWTFAPMIDVSREPRWGRIMEGPGEDPYLASQLAKAQINGFQQNDLGKINTIAACAKHFVAYGAPVGGRDYNTAEVSDYTLNNIYLPPFKASVEANAATFMNAFNTVNGRPATGNDYLVDKTLKDKWDFNGFVVSDWNSIGELVPHGVAKNSKEAAKIAIKGGTDMDMESTNDAYLNYLPELVKNGEVSEEKVNEAVKRILRVKYKLGLFEDPYQYSSQQREKETLLDEEHLKTSRKLAEESIVLLKNKNELLPLSKDIETIAVIGPLADDKDSPLGNWRAQGGNENAVSILEGIKQEVKGDTRVLHAQGCVLDKNNARGFSEKVNINTNDTSGFAEAYQTAQKADVIIAAVGETAYMSGEGRSRQNIDLPGVQKQLLKKLRKTGKPVIVTLMNGRPLALPWTDKNIPAIVETWFLGNEMGHAVANILFGDTNPSGKLPVTFPRDLGQVPIYYNHLPTGRPSSDDIFATGYIDGSTQPLYPFGYGLSYTDFGYSDFSLSSREIEMGERLKVKIKVKNTGDRVGEEIVQLYIRDLVANYSRPVKELKGFKKISLEPKEEKIVEFELNKNDFTYYNDNNEQIWEPGDYRIMIGKSSNNIKGEKIISIK